MAPGLITRLGVLSLVAAPLSFTGIWVYTRYRITRLSYDASMLAAAEQGPPRSSGSRVV